MKRRDPLDALAPLSQVNTEPAEPALVRTVRLLDAIMRPWTRRDWQDQHKIPQTGGAIFAVNHISNADPPAVGQFLAFSGRWPRFLAKSSLFDVPIVGRVLRACGQIPVQRQSPAAADALAAAVRAVELGQAVTVYPEGTITRDPGLWPMAGRTGASHLPADGLSGDSDWTVGCAGDHARHPDRSAEAPAAQDLAIQGRRSGRAR